MKRRYEKPMLCVERYALTQTIAACSGIKIKNDPNLDGSADVLNDPDATNSMKNWALRGGFLSGQCRVELDGMVLDGDGVCVHTNINAAFNS